MEEEEPMIALEERLIRGSSLSHLSNKSICGNETLSLSEGPAALAVAAS
jgi:hypothetical protein